MNALAATTGTPAQVALPPFLRRQMEVVLQGCTEFIAWQRREVILGHPSTETLAEHRLGLKWMLRLLRLLHTQAADPDFPDRQFVQEIEGRIFQLEEFWALLCEPLMTDAEAEALLSKTFPDDPLIPKLFPK